MMEMMKRLVRDEEGQGMVEYALIIALIAIVVMVAVKTLGTEVRSVFTDVYSEL